MVLAALAAAFLLLRARRVGGRSPRRAVRPAPDQPAQPEEDPASDAGILARELELLRLATDAHEAALWTRDTSGEQVSLVAWSGFPGRQATDASVVLEGHPFRWILDERVHVRLERGRRTLPTAWAEEMLLVPVDAPDGLLALAYPGGIPPGAEASALLAGAQLGSLLSLLRAKEQGARREAHVGALYRAVELLPHQLDRDRFAEALADVVREGVGAAGVAVIAWSADTATGEILRLTGDDPHGVAEGNRLEEGDSRATLAAKHAVALPYPDLRRERDRIPLVARGESWRLAPRSALVVPLSAEGQVLGVVVAWHGEAEHFGEPERSFLDHLSALAPFPMRSAQRYEALDRTANQDPLTGLHNRRAFDARFAAAAAHFSRYHRPFSVILLDIDHFKRFNDSWGHEAGDRVLQHVSELLRASIRDLDFSARYGGEEFVLLLPETSLMPAVEVAERVRREVHGRPLLWNGRALPMTVSLGVATCPDSLGDPIELLAAADAALYRSKNAGRNRTTAAPPRSNAG